ncbi:MAG TPA: M14 family zinc carboxypeptidase, partial [Pirellulaceae bacterium]
ILIPWGYQPAPVPDQSLLELISNTMAASIATVHGKFYEHGDPFLYLSSGTARDWTYGNQGIYSSTIELRPTSSNPGFELPATQIIPTGEELFPAALDLAEFTMKLAGGDFDANNVMNCTDVDKLVQAIVVGSNKAEFDLTGDGVINTSDLSNWLSRAGTRHLGAGRVYLPGDANLDGVVDGSDFNVWNSHKFTNSPAWCHGDFTADGVVDGSDFNAWNSRKFTSSDVSLIPEPATLAAIVLVLALIPPCRKPCSNRNFGIA